MEDDSSSRNIKAGDAPMNRLSFDSTKAHLEMQMQLFIQSRSRVLIHVMMQRTCGNAAAEVMAATARNQPKIKFSFSAAGIVTLPVSSVQLSHVLIATEVKLFRLVRLFRRVIVRLSVLRHLLSVI